jgi:hypothetical protein
MASSATSALDRVGDTALAVFLSFEEQWSGVGVKGTEFGLLRADLRRSLGPVTPYEAPEIEELPPPEWLEPLAPLAPADFWTMVGWWAPVGVLILLLVWIHRSGNLPQEWNDDPMSGGGPSPRS